VPDKEDGSKATTKVAVPDNKIDNNAGQGGRFQGDDQGEDRQQAYEQADRVSVTVPPTVALLSANVAASRTSQPGEVTTSTTSVWVAMAKAVAPRVSVTVPDNGAG
jgi:hypothetical protein